MKIFTTSQIKTLDAKTIELEKISSCDLMDRAAWALYQRIVRNIKPTEKIWVMAGHGNNGGDALAIARLLIKNGYQVQTLLCQGKALSDDACIQLARLQKIASERINIIENSSDLPTVDKADYLIDGLFGSGLNRPLTGFYAEVVRWMNGQGAKILSIDLPSGLFGEDNRENIPENIVKADLTLGLQFPRLSFFLAENESYIKKWELVDILFHPKAIEDIQTPYSFSLPEEMARLLKNRSRFSHKGTFGKGLLIAGSSGMMGAALLATKGALRAGIGLLSVRIPATGVSILQTAVPEALVQFYESESFYVPSEPIDLNGYSAIAVGPGIGTSLSQAASLRALLNLQPENLVLDADALNLLSENKELLGLLPPKTILTPHPKEFDRLWGEKAHSGYERLENAISFAREYQVYIVLKGAYSACITPEGSCCFNTTGNPGMSTGGSGDVLTGIVVSLRAQGYTAKEACQLGVFLHGLSGDIALGSESQESLLAGDLTEHLGKAFNLIRKKP